ncbi:MAG TPA: hypothetical protein VFM93_00530 [Candidatus Limnocylindria bacterium]|nr:hypothetical protein [Candidatus Limnocylindria bacterium]
MGAQLPALMAEARGLGLFRPHTASEVHCSNCHARLDARGDCPVCGLIGRADADIERRAQDDPAGTERLLSGAIAKRKAFTPAGKGGERG